MNCEVVARGVVCGITECKCMWKCAENLVQMEDSLLVLMRFKWNYIVWAHSACGIPFKIQMAFTQDYNNNNNYCKNYLKM